MQDISYVCKNPYITLMVKYMLGGEPKTQIKTYEN
jgi:flagellar motor switch protein FliM